MIQGMAEKLAAQRKGEEKKRLDVTQIFAVIRRQLKGRASITPDDITAIETSLDSGTQPNLPPILKRKSVDFMSNGSL
jgi:hypothetical protein